MVIDLGARVTRVGGVRKRRGKRIYLCGVRAVRSASAYLRLQRKEFVQGLGRDLVATLVDRRRCTLAVQG